MKKMVLLGLLFSASLIDIAAAKPAPISVFSLNNTLPRMQLSGLHDEYLLKMIPSRWLKNQSGIRKKRNAFAVAYKLLKNGQLQYMWNGVGIYPTIRSRGITDSSRILFSNNGRYVVKIKNITAISTKDVVILYRDGKVMRRYALNDFTSKKVPIKRYYLGARRFRSILLPWQKEEAWLSGSGYDPYWLHFTLFDGVKWMINLHTGRALKAL